MELGKTNQKRFSGARGDGQFPGRAEGERRGGWDRAEKDPEKKNALARDFPRTEEKKKEKAVGNQSRSTGG